MSSTAEVTGERICVYWQSVIDAVDCASAGDPVAGYGCLLEGLSRVEEGWEPGEPDADLAARYRLALASILMTLAFASVMTVLTFAFWHEAWDNNWRSESMWRARLWIPYSVMPIGLGLLTLQYIVELIKLVTGRAPPFGLPPKATAEEIARVEAEKALGGAG